MVKGYSENTVKILLDLANYLALMKHLRDVTWPSPALDVCFTHMCTIQHDDQKD